MTLFHPMDYKDAMGRPIQEFYQSMVIFFGNITAGLVQIDRPRHKPGKYNTIQTTTTTTFFSGMPHDWVLPCRRYVVRAWGHCWTPMLTDCTSVSIALCQLVRGGPQSLLQWLGGWSDATMTRWWSCLGSACATCPKKRSSLSNKVGNWRTPWQ